MGLAFRFGFSVEDLGLGVNFSQQRHGCPSGADHSVILWCM